MRALLMQHTTIAAQVCAALAEKLRGGDAARVISPLHSRGHRR